MNKNILWGNQPINQIEKCVKEEFVTIENDLFYKIENYTEIEPFFMTLTSNTNHWMFLSSTGGVTTGRVNSESSLFPYYTDDRITENITNTGPKTIILVTKDNNTYIWEPFTQFSNEIYNTSNNLYKNTLGNRVIFEEINNTLGVKFSYSWMNSRKFGIVRESVLTNLSDTKIEISLVDGVQNVLPAGVDSQIQNEFSCLLNGYKRTELDPTGVGLFTLSATLTDLAEPSESLKTNTIWQTGLEVKSYLLESSQLNKFRKGEELSSQTDVKGDRGAYFVESQFILNSKESKNWLIVLDVEKDLTELEKLKNIINYNDNILNSVKEDVALGSKELTSILNQNDGLQVSNKSMNSVHHQANILFNIMRGGYFSDSYNIDINDFADFIKITNINVYKSTESELLKLDHKLDYNQVKVFVDKMKDSDLQRIWVDYLPLTFSRRHGDPSRPWNKFSIETEKEDGSAKLDYQGNWRDIFQNWEALCYSYPKYLKHVIGKFFNASTMDGYNPYRVSRNGIDWECPEPGNPWANIGYWSDHQIIYLLKLLELYKSHKPKDIVKQLDSRSYTFANVPYEIKGFENIISDPYETITFNFAKDKEVKALAKQIGADGKMLHRNNEIVLGSMNEKLLIHLLTKLGNFVPEGGIWMNTQRPEWNDANNALVGKGISVVTLAYIRRYINFLINIYKDSNSESFTIRKNLYLWLTQLNGVFSNYTIKIKDKITDKYRFEIVSQLGKASETYRNSYYNAENWEDINISRSEIIDFLNISLISVDDSLLKNRRTDDLYHSYNTLEISNKEIKIHYLYEMLEGQVAILTSGLLGPKDADKTLTALRNSAMFREDQNSYMLYPNRELLNFTKKNVIDANKVEANPVLMELIKKGNKDLVTVDVNGKYHFNGKFKNVKQVIGTLDKLGLGRNKEIEDLFEQTFNHQSFTGRSGTFFAYEGLGSIYWHMVSKLLLAAQENLFIAKDMGLDEKLINSLKNHYVDIRNGIGYKKSAEVYGAFPFDPYSHTPFGKGAKQPGMTGQVKEEVITRLGEMGIRVINGEIIFDTTLMDEDDFLTSPRIWSVKNAAGETLELNIPSGAFAGTHCQTPYIVAKGEKSCVNLYMNNGTTLVINQLKIPVEYSELIFSKSPDIKYIEIIIGK